jgi:hypothetical protein
MKKKLSSSKIHYVVENFVVLFSLVKAPSFYWTKCPVQIVLPMESLLKG